MKKQEAKLYGLSYKIVIPLLIIGFLGMSLEVFKTDMPTTLFLMFVIGIPLYELGNRIPVWNKYVGGGIVLTFLLTPVLAYFNIIPSIYVEAISNFTHETNFLNLFIIILITGSILSLHRSILIHSFIAYIPAILGGIVGAALLAILVGLIFRMSPSDILVNFVLPIMGGGNGGGAVPLSQIYADITGMSKDVYYQFSILILTIANIFSIILASILNSIGNKYPSLTGNKSDLIRNPKYDFNFEHKKKEASAKDYGAAIFLSLGAYAFAEVLSLKLLPSIFGVKIHTFAYLVILVIGLALLDLIPSPVKAATKALQSFFSKYLTLIIMVGVGVELDLSLILGSLTLSNLLIALAVVIGSIIGAGFVGYLLGFYPIDSAVTAGLCMANRGGSGDLAVLGAADRMDLMAYGQLSSRLGGAIILILGSILFTIFY